jgi:hypothetical protein
MDATTSSTIDPESMYDYMNGLLISPTAFIILVFVVIIYIIFFVSLGDSSTTTYSATNSGSSGLESSTNLIIIVVIGILIVLILFNALQYFFSIDIIASIQNLFTSQKQLDIKVIQDIANPFDLSFNNPAFSDLNGKQVFNIPGNHYGYEEAQTLCKAYDSRLATYDEVENSYNKGGEWCNYGWSDGQMALFPTQKVTFDNLQKIAGHEHDCGRTGINGGYIANPRVKFGVNCFGYKPKITSEEEEMMQNTTPYPKTEKDVVMEKQVDFWKTKIDDILLSPFNYTTWSKV